MVTLMNLILSISICIVVIVIYIYRYIYRYIYDNEYDELITFENKFVPDKLSDFCMQQILTESEASFIAEKVKKNKRLWKKKNIIMSILGTATYLEAIDSFDNYKKEYEKTNKILIKKFPELFDKILDYFQKRSPDTPVKYRFALPGFHIFKCNTLFSLPVASVHRDRQYEHLPFTDIDLDNTLSFTLCLELPPTGGGLYKFEKTKKTKIEYKPGYIVCHNGKTTHQIAPSKNVKNYDYDYYRITLQGHGVFDKNTNTWWLYW